MLKPLPAARWDFRAAAHLLNRAGFGGSPAQVEELEALGHEAAVERLVDYEKIPDPTPDPDWAKPGPDRAGKIRQARAASEEERRRIVRQVQQTDRQRMLELRGWWLNRMANGPRPFQEKMVLFWHGHFATSVEKVREAYLMWRQNELFRRLATGSWTNLLLEVSRDPAMLVWLDQAQSRKEHPNENFAREVMELFALGEGNYTEQDVTEGARALTGWSYERLTQRFVQRPVTHDPGEKTIFGKTGPFDGQDFIELVAQHPATGPFITSKLWSYFTGQPASAEMTAALAERFRKGNNQFKPVLRAMFLSEEFYAPEIVRNQVKSPVQWLVGSVRVLERDLPPPLVCFTLTRNLGQDLFAPPNVKGWDGGLSWITTNNLLSRYNEAAALVHGDMSGVSVQVAPNPTLNQMMERRLRNAPTGSIDAGKLLPVTARRDKPALMAAIQKRLLQDQLKPKQQKALREFLDGQTELNETAIRNAIRLVMATPEYQLC